MRSYETFPGFAFFIQCIREDESKVQASNTLTGWQAVVQTAAQWVDELERGHTTHPSKFSPTPDNTYSHSKEFWQGTHFVLADADVNPFLSARGLFILCADKTPLCSTLGNFFSP